MSSLRSRLTVASVFATVLAAGAAVASAVTTSSQPAVVSTAGATTWTRSFFDDFGESAIDPSRWRVYRGHPRGDPDGYWLPSHAGISGGSLHLRGYRDGAYFTTAGLSMTATHSQTYGQYSVRMRIAKGEGVAFALVLWPENDAWPPEVDFAEDNGLPARSLLTATLHWRTASVLNATKALRYGLPVNTSGWHTYGVAWEPGLLTYTIDHHVWGVVRSDAVPATPMVLTLQTQAWHCGHAWEHCPTVATPKEIDMDVDWVIGYRRA
jgi:beta-glucanase (GH16 family)